MTTIPLPASIEYGKIVGQLAMTSLDGEDVDEKPDGKGVTGSVTLAPLDGQGEVIEGIFVFIRSFTVPLSDEGIILTRAGQPGVWLPVGVWRATFSLVGVAMEPREFEVTTAHTALVPLNIIAGAPPLGPILIPSQYSALDIRLTELEQNGGGGGGISVVNNGDGTLTLSGSGVVNNGDGTLTLA